MPQYEVNVILNPNLDGAAMKIETDIVKATLEKHGAQIKNVDEWGQKRLAYPMQKDPEGFVVFYTVDMPGAGPQPIQKELRLRDHVRRVTIIRDRPEWRK